LAYFNLNFCFITICFSSCAVLVHSHWTCFLESPLLAASLPAKQLCNMYVFYTKNK